MIGRLAASDQPFPLQPQLFRGAYSTKNSIKVSEMKLGLQSSKFFVLLGCVQPMFQPGVSSSAPQQSTTYQERRLLPMQSLVNSLRG